MDEFLPLLLLALAIGIPLVCILYRIRKARRTAAAEAKRLRDERWREMLAEESRVRALSRSYGGMSRAMPRLRPPPPAPPFDWMVRSSRDSSVSDDSPSVGLFSGAPIFSASADPAPFVSGGGGDFGGGGADGSWTDAPSPAPAPAYEAPSPSPSCDSGSSSYSSSDSSSDSSSCSGSSE